MKINSVDLSKLNGYKAEAHGDIGHYATNLPLIKVGEDYHILFERRSNSIAVQPGEICLPGGGVEKGESYPDCAIRETCEELGIRESDIRMISALDYLMDPPARFIAPFLTELNLSEIEGLRINKAEVESVFTVPLEFFVENEPVSHTVYTLTEPQDDFPFHLIPDERAYNWGKRKRAVYFYQYEEYIIWGLTAKIVKNFVDTLKKLGGVKNSRLNVIDDMERMLK